MDKNANPMFVYDRNENLQLLLFPRNFSSLHENDPTMDNTIQAGSYVGREHEERQILMEDSDSGALPYRDAWLIEQLNGQERLEFEVLANDPNAEFIENDGRIVVKGVDGEYAEFIIRNVEDTDDQGGTVKVVEAEGGEYELIDEFITGYEHASVSLTEALNAVLQGTRIQLGQIDVYGKKSVSLNHMSVKQAVYTLLNIFGGERKFRVEHRGNKVVARYLDVYVSRGERTGKRFEEGVDIISTSREVNTEGIKTALYGLGKSEEGEEGEESARVDFSTVEWRRADGDPVDKPLGQAWVGDPNAMGLWGYSGGRRHRFGLYDGQEEDPATLLLNTWEDLQKRNAPNVTYDFTVIELEEILGGEYSFERVRLGDVTHAINKRIYPHVVTENTVIEYRFNLNNSKQSEVTLGNFRSGFDMSEKVNDLESDYNDKRGEFDGKPSESEVDAKDEIVKDEIRGEVVEGDNGLRQEIEEELGKVDGSISDAKDRAEDAFNKANDAVDKAQEGFDKAQDAILNGTVADGKAEDALIEAQKGFDKAQDAIKEANKANSKYSAVKKTVDYIATRVQTNDDNFSAMTQTVEGFQKEVNKKVNTTTYNSKMTQLAGVISSKVSETDANNRFTKQSEFQQTAGKLALRVEKVENGEVKGFSALEVRVGSIASRVQKSEKEFSAMSHTVEGFQSTVRDLEGNVTTATLTAEAAVTRVGTVEDDSEEAFSQISQLKDDINLRVTKGDIANQINITPQGILLDADKINFNGKVIGNKGATFKGKVTASQIQGGTISGVNMMTASGSVSTSKRGNHIHMYEQSLHFKTDGTTKMSIGFDGFSKLQEPFITMGKGKSTGTSLAYIEKNEDDFTLRYVTENKKDSKLYFGHTGSSRMTTQGTFYFATDFKVEFDTFIEAKSFNNISTVKVKDNIKKYEGDALGIVMDTDIFNYHYKSDLEKGIFNNEQVGFLAEGSPMLKHDDAISINKAVAYNWVATQTQQEKIEKLEKDVEDLTDMIAEM